jgi:hypothetical protein
MDRALSALLVVLAGASAMAAESLPAALVSAEGDRVLAATVVPDAVRKVGEVRLVARGDGTVVQTLLATKALSRVVSEIRKKEEGNWPVGKAGREDMERYLAGLFRVADSLVARRDGAGDEDRRIRLAIEFVATRDVTGLSLAEFDGAEDDGRFRTVTLRPVETFPLPRAYVLRNMRLILADAFHVSERDVGTLGPLGPAADVP